MKNVICVLLWLINIYDSNAQNATQQETIDWLNDKFRKYMKHDHYYYNPLIYRNAPFNQSGHIFDSILFNNCSFTNTGLDVRNYTLYSDYLSHNPDSLKGKKYSYTYYSTGGTWVGNTGYWVKEKAKYGDPTNEGKYAYSYKINNIADVKWEVTDKVDDEPDGSVIDKVGCIVFVFKSFNSNTGMYEYSKIAFPFTISEEDLINRLRKAIFYLKDNYCRQNDNALPSKNNSEKF